MFTPISTYRIQFHKDFTFKHLNDILPYLQHLGFSTIYASPIFAAVPGSMHGYDCTTPLAINEEIGSLDELRELSTKLKAAGMSWIQDIVPNHAAFHPHNKWLMDVLAKGKASEFANYFDIDYNSPGNEKLMVPFLGKPLEEVINDGDLKLAFHQHAYVFELYGNCYPLSPESIDKFLQNSKEEDIESFNDDKILLLQIAGSQHYRFCRWQETDHQINYRRFFTVNGLICLNMQDEAVFTRHHQFIKQLVDEGIFQGLRIDHVDGLQNPTEYLDRLRKLVGASTYIIAEKILAADETLPPSWPLQGTSGYDFLALVNRLLTSQHAEENLTAFYQNHSGDYESIPQAQRDKKAFILGEHLQGELTNLYRHFIGLNLIDKRRLSVIPSEDIKSALGEMLIQCPVYRFYGTAFPLKEKEEQELRNLLLHVKRSGESTAAVKILEDVFFQQPHLGDESLNKRIAFFYQRCMQFTGPLMAKGVEDTLMYSYNRFIGHNEVGDSPENFGIAVPEMHRRMQQRQQHWPQAMNATATHDTKRGEDARARLQVITDLHEEWLEKVAEWQTINASLVQQYSIHPNEEYLLYQSLVAHYHKAGEESFSARWQAFIEKALREGKQRSNWTSPDNEYEQATKEFALRLLEKQSPFWQSFQDFQQHISAHAVINSLAQVLLKFALPGVPDTYQGTEGWDFSFVDPDNRRPVNYLQKEEELHSFDHVKRGLLKRLWENKEDGKIKLWLLQQLLLLRNSESSLFAEGDYIPLQTQGHYKDNVFAFARRQADRVYVFVVPVHTASLCREQSTSFFQLDWKDTTVLLPQHNGAFEHLLQKTEGDKIKKLEVKNLFKRFPLAALRGKQTTKQRGAGLLLHITSLPSAHGIGDLGIPAKNFADFLHRSGQKYWQLLPLNPTEAGQSFSPYSALSSKAGWPLLISPETLVQQNWLTQDDLPVPFGAEGSSVDFVIAEEQKYQLLQKAFERFQRSAPTETVQAFQLFCEKEKSWLHDFALFQLLKQKNDGLPWHQWPQELKQHGEAALQIIAEENEIEIKQIKWYQYQFHLQWQELKTYCNNRNIQLIGDMPFYVSYDSADVWAAQQLFSLDKNGERMGVAGVPPDAFSADGQLWGMPTFNWPQMEAENYVWWIQRLRKNIELFNLTRLDHFRAFAAYWQVAAQETTAKNGEWIPGPGVNFFKAIQREFGQLPFVAEDLGDINEEVLTLRDEFNLPGMKVLQFAFGSDVASSAYSPHNYQKNFLVYTGTHDNNTTVGWWRNEADDATKKRVMNYTGITVNESNVHEVMMRMAYASVADIAIIPMQDVLGLDENARMNIPSSTQNNWSWRLKEGDLHAGVEKQLKEWTALYNRD